MGGLAEQRAAIVVRAVSPDHGVKGEARGGDAVDVWFAQGAYRRYDEDILARQLGRLATLLWVRYRREYLEIGELVMGPRIDDGDGSRAEAEFWRRLERLEARGESPDGVVTAVSRGMVEWEFGIARGALGTYDQAAFCEQVRAAGVAVLVDHRRQVARLTDELFDLGLPRWRKKQWHATA